MSNSAAFVLHASGALPPASDLPVEPVPAPVAFLVPLSRMMLSLLQ